MKLPWRLTHLGGLYNTTVGVRLRRPWLRYQLRRATDQLPDDVTVVIGHRNRPDYRLRNAIRSVQAQHYPAGAVRLLIVDYGSEPESRRQLLAITAAMGVECLESKGRPVWNRSHCLNLGIKHAATKFVMVSDVDVLLAENYLAEAVGELRRNPLSVVYSRCVHLPESCAGRLEAAAPDGGLDLATLRDEGKIKTADRFSTGMAVGYTFFFHLIRGYDEFYQAYGVEDTDLAERFLRLGLSNRSIADQSFYLHQWHPRYEGVGSETLAQTIQRNRDYFNATRTIRRNPEGWGLAT